MLPPKLRSSMNAKRERMSLIRSTNRRKKKKEEPEELGTRTDTEESTNKEREKLNFKMTKKKRQE